ncbi:hypothetical protein DESC_120012 [Desulfosarcina cetonica]|nr:hypothetical protein DESC_120012 [Desulfosarcina cetonica]
MTTAVYDWRHLPAHPAPDFRLDQGVIFYAAFPPATGRRRAYRFTGPGGRRRRIRQDPYPDGQIRPPGDFGNAAGTDSGDHLHQQGGRRDEGAPVAHDRHGTDAFSLGADLPLRLLADFEGALPAFGLPHPFADLHPLPPAEDHQGCSDRAQF